MSTVVSTPDQDPDFGGNEYSRPIRSKKPFIISRRVSSAVRYDPRVPSTDSPLANPTQPIHKLAVDVQSILYLPDPSPLYVVAGAIVANMMRGYPVWLMLIGPPESGKTELIKHWIGLDGIRECGDLSGKAALLSGTRAKDVTADATGGILKDLKCDETGVHRGCLVMMDFARTVLAADPQSARATMGAIGMIHDQHYQREVGTDGGKTISFSGRVGFIAACTDIIDHPDHQQANAEMGDRCIYYRYPESDGYHEISSALSCPDGASKQTQLTAIFHAWFNWISLSWDDPTEPTLPSESDKRMIIALSQLTARGRSTVLRDRYKSDIIGVNRPALGPRIALTLMQLLRALERLGCTQAERAHVLRSCAMDSIPAVKAAAIRAICVGARGISDVTDKLHIGVAATKRTLEDLRAHGLLTCDRPDSLGRWSLSALTEELMRDGWDQMDDRSQ